MRNFDRVNAPPPPGIEHKRAHIIGGGLAGLSAAIALISDAHMAPDRVFIYEAGPDLGGAMDAAGDHTFGYTCRGERELEAWMECLWYVCAKVPSIQTPGMTILDETFRANQEEPIYSHFRLMHKKGQRYSTDGALMSVHDAKRMSELFLACEVELEGLTVDDWFSPAFTQSVFWYCWSTMLAFKSYHSLIEVRRYLLRFMMYAPGLTHLAGILHTQYNEFDSIIKPMVVWLRSLGVQFRIGTTVTDMDLHDENGQTTVGGLELRDGAGGVSQLVLSADDLVFFTNGSLTQNTTMGSTHAAAPLNRTTQDRGCFTLWEKLAARDPKFGNPHAFISDIDRSNWISFFPTIKGDRTLFDHLEKLTGDKAGTGGAMSVVDSPWNLGFILYSKYFPDQPADVNVLWACAQVTDVPGVYVKKTAIECTGEEMLAELLYHCGLESHIEHILAHTSVSTATMPYITSQFMPRRIADRPQVIPDGCVNLAFIGQFVELPQDVVFTVETSVRTALMAVWGLTGLDKPMIPIHEPAYDIRVLAANAKACLGLSHISISDLPLLMRASPSIPLLASRLNDLPPPPI